MKSLKHAGEFGSVHFSKLNCLSTGEHLLEVNWLLQAWLHPGEHWQLNSKLVPITACGSQLKATLAAQRALRGSHLCYFFTVLKGTTSFPYSPLWMLPMPSEILLFCKKRSRVPLFFVFSPQEIILTSKLHLTLSYFVN